MFTRYPFILITLLLLTSLTTSTKTISFPQITSQNIHNWSYIFDSIHRFIILDQRLLPQLQKTLPSGNNIEYYSHDCVKNNTMIRTCQSNKYVAALVIFNKVPIQYEVWDPNVDIADIAAVVNRWVRDVVQAGFKRNLGNIHIQEILEDKGELFILVQNKTLHQLEMGYNIISKQFYYKDFIYISDLSISRKLNLNIGDFLHIKHLSSPFSLPEQIKNTTVTTLFPNQATKRYDILKAFVLQNIYTRGFDKNVDRIQQQRFNIRVRKLQDNGQYNYERGVIVFCDLSLACAEFLDRFDEEILRDPVGRRTSVKRIFYRNQMMKNIQLIEIFFHIKIRHLKLPYAFITNGEDPNTPHLPLRFSLPLSITSTNPLTQLNSYLHKIDNNEIKNTYLSSGIPKKNGFSGKGAQKRVQKVSYQTYKKAIKQAHDNNKYYLLFISAFQFDCPQCVKFYGEYKKLASFLETEDNANIVLGVYDLSKDQIDLKSMSAVPSVLLFIPGRIDPVQYNRRYEFQDVMKFIKQERRKQEKPQPEVIRQKVNQQVRREVHQAILTGQQAKPLLEEL